MKFLLLLSFLSLAGCNDKEGLSLLPPYERIQIGTNYKEIKDLVSCNTDTSSVDAYLISDGVCTFKNFDRSKFRKVSAIFSSGGERKLIRVVYYYKGLDVKSVKKSLESLYGEFLSKSEGSTYSHYTTQLVGRFIKLEYDNTDGKEEMTLRLSKKP